MEKGLQFAKTFLSRDMYFSSGQKRTGKAKEHISSNQYEQGVDELTQTGLKNELNKKRKTCYCSWITLHKRCKSKKIGTM